MNWTHYKILKDSFKYYKKINRKFQFKRNLKYNEVGILIVEINYLSGLSNKSVLYAYDVDLFFDLIYDTIGE